MFLIAQLLVTLHLSCARTISLAPPRLGNAAVSLLYAAGDEGANCKGDPNKFVPETPGSSPWVTSVGGTEGATNEQAIGLSSGGFSNRCTAASALSETVPLGVIVPMSPGTRCPMRVSLPLCPCEVGC